LQEGDARVREGEGRGKGRRREGGRGSRDLEGRMTGGKRGVKEMGEKRRVERMRRRRKEMGGKG